MSEQPSTPPPGQDPPPVAAPQPVAAPPMSESDVRQWAMFCHLGAFAQFVGVPFGGLIAPIVIWQIKKDAHPFIDEQGKESVNFQLSVLVAVIACIPLCFILIGFLLLVVVGIGNIVYIILAALAANKGEHYRYPVSIRFIK